MFRFPDLEGKFTDHQKLKHTKFIHNKHLFNFFSGSNS